MSGSFVHHAEPVAVVDDGNRELYVSLGEVGGLDLAYLGLKTVDGKVDAVFTLDEVRQLVRVLQGIDPQYRSNRFAELAGYYLYRVVITGYPDGALVFHEYDGERYGEPDPEWRPDGWSPSEEWLARFGDQFFWPSIKHEYKSKSAARERARLIESYGATAVVERSSLITWPSAADADQIYSQAAMEGDRGDAF